MKFIGTLLFLFALHNVLARATIMRFSYAEPDQFQKLQV